MPAPKTLTSAAIAKIKPTDERQERRDTARGLYLIIQPRPSGKKSWAVRFRRPDGKPAKLTLGSVDTSKREPTAKPVIGGTLTVGEARLLAAGIDNERAGGLDVIEEHHAKRMRQKIAAQDRAANTFGACARQFFGEYRTKHKQRPRGWRSDALALGLRYPLDADPATTEPEAIKGGLAANWDTKPVAEIDGNHVHAVVRDASRTGIPGLGRRNNGISETRGRRMHAALSVLFRWLVRQRKITSNPCVGVDRPAPPRDRDRVLNDVEVVAFMNACEQIGKPFGPLFKVLLLTSARLREAAGMTRAELVDNVWTIPAERTKNHRPLVLPLPPWTHKIITAAMTEGTDFVFTTNGRSPVSGFSRAKKQLDDAMKAAGHDVPPFRLHDLRRTAATGMAKLGIALPVIEKVLNHVSGSFAGIVSVYQRFEYTDEKAEALARWAAHVDGLVTPRGNVVDLKKPVRRRGKS